MIALQTRIWSDLPANIRGAICVTAGAIVLVVMASLVKHLGQEMPAFEVLFIRFLVGLIAILPVVARNGFSVLRTRKPHLHVLRGLAGFMGNLCLFFALIHMAIADTITIQFSRPLVMIVIAGVFLGETVGPRRGIVTLAGFAGIMMITRPFGTGFEPWALVALGGTFFASVVVLSVKLLSRTEPTLVIMFYFATITTALSAVPAFVTWQPPSGTELALLVLVDIMGIVGQSLFTHGVGLGETSFIMPFDYLRIPFSFVIGMIWFGETPVAWSVAGTLIIIVSSFYLLRGERIGARAPAKG